MSFLNFRLEEVDNRRGVESERYSEHLTPIHYPCDCEIRSQGGGWTKTGIWEFFDKKKYQGVLEHASFLTGVDKIFPNKSSEL